MKVTHSHHVILDQSVRIGFLKTFTFKHWILAIEPVEAPDPCDPNPCGPNTNTPQVIGDRCQCTCVPDMIGSPPNCKPECVLNSDCRPELACISRKCRDPCPGLCGQNAQCRVRNHVPLCICNRGYEGDPFSACRLITSKIKDSFHYFIFNKNYFSYFSKARKYWSL